MFDPHDYFDIRHHRAVCPVHGKRDRNLLIKRHKTEPKWVFNCYSRGCSLKEIAEAAGFNPADIYDDDRDPDWRPVITATEVGGLDALIAIQKKRKPTLDIAQKVEDTFGPNPCTGLKLHNETSGETLALICDQKRCVHCSPRKQMTIQLQMQALGEYVYVARLTNLDELNRSLERVKKQAQRESIDYKYQIVGDERLGWIVISTVELLTEQRYMKLSDWMKRILDLYRYARGRIRRSYALGRVSLVPLRRKSNSGQRSSWYRRSADTEAVRAVEDLDWDELRDEIDYQHGNVYDIDPTGGEEWVSPM